MAPTSHDSDAARARLVLGLSGAATDTELQAAYWALRAHIESRALASEDPGFVAARTAELQRLTERLAVALDVAPDSLPPPELDWVHVRVQRRPWTVIAGIVGFALALAVGFLFWLQRSSDDPGDASPLAAVAPVAPPGRLVFAQSETPARFSVLDAEGSRVVRAGITSGDPVELPPGAYAVWLSALGCDASRQHTVQLDAEATLELAVPVCTRTLELVVRSDVTGDVVRIDGEARGGTGPRPHLLYAGPHEVEIELDGEPAWRARIDVGEGDRLTLHADLSKPGPTRSESEPRPEGDAPPPPPPPPPAGSGAPDVGPDGMGGTATEDALRDARAAGSRSWHEGVRLRLIDKYDSNGSHDLDTTVEIASIPCTEWRAIESQYDAGGLQVPMTRLYGFDGSEWVEGALGIERTLRDYTYRRMQECGLK